MTLFVSNNFFNLQVLTYYCYKGKYTFIFFITSYEQTFSKFKAVVHSKKTVNIKKNITDEIS